MKPVIAQLPIAYMAALPGDTLQRLVMHQALTQLQTVFGTFPEPECGRVSAHIALHLGSLVDEDREIGEMLIGDCTDDTTEVAAYYLGHEVLEASDTEYWMPAGLYAKVVIYVTRGLGPTDATSYVTALRWDEKAFNWRLLWDTSHDEDHVWKSIPAMPVEGNDPTPGLRSILTLTRHSESVLPPSPGAALPTEWRS